MEATEAIAVNWLRKKGNRKGRWKKVLKFAPL